jgi:hypothetical protein
MVCVREEKVWNMRFKRRNSGVDTRAKIIYASAGDSSIICLNLFDVIVNGKMVTRNKNFVDFLKSLIPKEQVSFPNDPQHVDKISHQEY